MPPCRVALATCATPDKRPRPPPAARRFGTATRSYRHIRRARSMDLWDRAWSLLQGVYMRIGLNILVRTVGNPLHESSMRLRDRYIRSMTGQEQSSYISSIPVRKHLLHVSPIPAKPVMYRLCVPASPANRTPSQSSSTCSVARHRPGFSRFGVVYHNLANN